jgi:polyhydroxyalkanoate synthase subunit PhaE
MAELDYAKMFTDMWTKSGGAVTAAQQAMMKDIASRMALPGLMMMPWQAFTIPDGEFQNAAAAFQKLMETWKDLPATLTGGGKASRDRITTELLQRIFDPREWLSAIGIVDEPMRQLSEGPRFADFGHIEGKFVALMSAWAAVRTASIEHQTNVLDAWTKAATEFAGKLNEAANKGKLIDSRSDLVAMWVEVANRHLLEAQSTPAFLDTQRKLLRASTDLRIAQQELADLYGEVFGFPTRPEIDDLTRTVSELRRELRALRRVSQDSPAPSRRGSKPKVVS